MKKKLLPLVMILVFAGFPLVLEGAEIEGNGWTLGGGLSLGKVREEMVFTAIPQAAYSNTFGPGSVYLQLEVFYSFLHIFHRDTNSVEFILDPPQTICLEGEVAWNFFQASSALFTFTLNEKLIFNNQNSEIADILLDISPYRTREWLSGATDPSFTYTQDVNSNEVFGTVGFPLTYVFRPNSDPLFGTYLTLGYNSSLGVGLRAKGLINLHPNPDYAGTEYLLYYKDKKSYFELKILTDKKMTTFRLTPMMEWTGKKFIFSGEVNISNMNRNSAAGDITLIPTFWVKLRI